MAWKVKTTFSESFYVSEIKFEFSNIKFLSFCFLDPLNSPNYFVTGISNKCTYVAEIRKANLTF